MRGGSEGNGEVLLVQTLYLFALAPLFLFFSESGGRKVAWDESEEVCLWEKVEETCF